MGEPLDEIRAELREISKSLGELKTASAVTAERTSKIDGFDVRLRAVEAEQQRAAVGGKVVSSGALWALGIIASLLVAGFVGLVARVLAK